MGRIDHGNGTSTIHTYDPSGTTTIPTYYIDEHFELEDTTPVKHVFAGNLRVARATPSGTIR